MNFNSIFLLWFISNILMLTLLLFTYILSVIFDKSNIDKLKTVKASEIIFFTSVTFILNKVILKNETNFVSFITLIFGMFIFMFYIKYKSKYLEKDVIDNKIFNFFLNVGFGLETIFNQSFFCQCTIIFWGIIFLRCFLESDIIILQILGGGVWLLFLIYIKLRTQLLSIKDVAFKADVVHQVSPEDLENILLKSLGVHYKLLKGLGNYQLFGFPIKLVRGSSRPVHTARLLASITWKKTGQLLTATGLTGAIGYFGPIYDKEIGEKNQKTLADLKLTNEKILSARDFFEKNKPINYNSFDERRLKTKLDNLWEEQRTLVTSSQRADISGLRIFHGPLEADPHFWNKSVKIRTEYNEVMRELLETRGQIPHINVNYVNVITIVDTFIYFI